MTKDSHVPCAEASDLLAPPPACIISEVFALSTTALTLAAASAALRAFFEFLFLLPFGLPIGLPVLKVHALLLLRHRSHWGNSLVHLS
jgi:hypothetical protein